MSETPTGVILAAGSGVRLKGGPKPKPLARVAGLTLLERSVITLRDAGVDRIIVVIGHAKDEIRRFVAERGLDVELVENDDFAVGNGSSALVGGRAAGGRFLLAMVDHLFETAAIRRMLATNASFAAAVDTRPRFCNVAEATKLRLEDSRVVAVGRDLTEFDAVDAGLFLCDGAVLAAAERALTQGDGTWNAMKRRCLAEGAELVAVDLDGTFWIDVDTPDEMRRAERLLVERAAGKPADGPVSRHLNRRLSRPVSLALVRLGASPNQATVLAFLVSLAAAAALALGRASPAALVAGGLAVQLASVLDGVDGEIARASGRSSARGAFLDSVLDRVGEGAVLVGLALAAGLETGTWAALAAALFGSLLVPYVKASYEGCYGRPFPAEVYRIGLGHDVRMLVIALAAVALHPDWGLYAAAVLANLEAVRRMVGVRRAAPR